MSVIEATEASSLPTLDGSLATLRAPVAADAESLLRIVSDPAVAEWWPEHTIEDVRRDFVEGGYGWTVVVAGEIAGWLEFDEHTDEMYSWVGLDIFITTALHGEGHGREVLRLAIRHFIARGHHRFTIDPAVDNERAIGAYAGVGFRPVGVMRSYERAADGTLHDALLMDLLADEFTG